MGIYPEFIGWQSPLERTLPNLTTIIVMKPVLRSSRFATVSSSMT
jgi:hypothetical protein